MAWVKKVKIESQSSVGRREKAGVGGVVMAGLSNLRIQNSAVHRVRHERFCMFCGCGLMLGIGLCLLPAGCDAQNPSPRQNVGRDMHIHQNTQTSQIRNLQPSSLCSIVPSTSLTFALFVPSVQVPNPYTTNSPPRLKLPREHRASPGFPVHPVFPSRTGMFIFGARYITSVVRSVEFRGVGRR